MIHLLPHLTIIDILINKWMSKANLLSPKRQKRVLSHIMQPTNCFYKIFQTIYNFNKNEIIVLYMF